MNPERKEALITNLKRWLFSAVLVGIFLYVNAKTAPVIPVAIGFLGTFLIVLIWSLYKTRGS